MPREYTVHVRNERYCWIYVISHSHLTQTISRLVYSQLRYYTNNFIETNKSVV
jgi:hypothetical protein